MFFSPFSIAITSLGEERVNLSAFRTFVRFALIWLCLFPLPLGCLGRAAVCDCATSWTFLLPFFFYLCFTEGPTSPKLNALYVENPAPLAAVKNPNHPEKGKRKVLGKPCQPLWRTSLGCLHCLRIIWCSYS